MQNLNQSQPEREQPTAEQLTAEPSIQVGGELSTIFEKYACPAELIVRYSPQMSRTSNVIQTWQQSTFKFALSNMDLPWIITLGAALSSSILSLIAVATCVSYMQVFAQLSLSTICSLFVGMSFFAYYPLVALNLRLAYGSNWLDTILGPTHIGITDSGFKLYWRGRLFYNYPVLGLWSDVFEVDIVPSVHTDVPTLRFVYQSCFGRKEVVLCLDGFSSVAELQMVLQHFARYVPLDHQQAGFRQASEENFATILKLYGCSVSAGQLLVGS